MRYRPFIPISLAIALTLGIVATSNAAERRVAMERLERWDNGKVKERRTYDERYRPIEVRFYREDTTLRLSEAFDERNVRIEECRYGPTGLLEEQAGGWAARRWSYYDNGNVAEELLFGADTKLKVRRIFGRDGELVDETILGPDEPENESLPVDLAAARGRSEDALLWLPPTPMKTKVTELSKRNPIQTQIPPDMNKEE